MKKIFLLPLVVLALSSIRHVQAQVDPLSVQVLDFCYEDESGRCLLAILPQGGIPPYRFHLPDGRIIEGYVYQRVLGYQHEYPFSVSDATGQFWSYQYTNNCVGYPPPQLEIELSSSLPYDALVQMYEPVGMPVVAEHFNQVKDACFVLNWAWTGQPDSIVWHPSLNISPSQYRLGFNEMSVYWHNPQGVTLPADEPLATVWFSAQDSVPDCSMRFSIRHILNVQDQQLLPDNAVYRRVHPQLSPDYKVYLDTIQAHTYAEVCVPMIAQQFEKLLGLQLTMLYDTSHLRYTRSSIMLTGLENAAPYTNHDGRGAINVIWIGDGIAEITKAPGETVMEFCFEPKRQGVSPLRIAHHIAPPDGTGFDTLPPQAVSSWLQEIPFYALPGLLEVLPTTQVYPGDADANGIANHYDLLYSGLAAGLLNHQRGPRPVGPSTQWAAQAALDWGTQTPNSHINLAHADADGNGLIDQQDVAALAQNYGLRHAAWEGDELAHHPVPQVLTADEAPLYVLMDSIPPNQAVVSFPIVLGESSQPVQGASGVAFSIYYDPSLVLAGSMSVDFEGSWLAAAAAERFSLAWDVPVQGRIDVAISRSDGQAVDGYGAIGQLSWTPLLPAGARQMELRPDHVLLLNEHEAMIPVSARPSQVALPNGSVTAVDDDPQAADRLLRLYPNPVQESLFIQSPAAALERIECWTSGGVLARSYAPNHRINVAELPGGTYWFRFYTRHGVSVRKVVKR